MRLVAPPAAREALYWHRRRLGLATVAEPIRPLGEDPTFDTAEALLAWDDEQCRILSWAQFAGSSVVPFIRADIARIKRVRSAHAHLFGGFA